MRGACPARPLPSITIQPTCSLPCFAEVASPEDFGAFDEQGRLLVEGYPPTAFVRMAGDGSDESSRANVRRFQQAGIPSGVITVGGGRPPYCFFQRCTADGAGGPAAAPAAQCCH